MDFFTELEAFNLFFDQEVRQTITDATIINLKESLNSTYEQFVNGELD